MSNFVYTEKRDGLRKEDILTMEWEPHYFNYWCKSGRGSSMYMGEYTDFSTNMWDKHELSEDEFNYLRIKML